MTAAPWHPDMETISKGVEYRGASGSQPIIASPRYCPGVNNNGGYLCETGHCCGETGCCTYYYELWWFWLLWTILILFSCCCAYRHRRAKLRIQQQQRQREINLIAYHGACNYPTSMLDLSFLASFKLPSYEEVAARPNTPPPPYSTVFALQYSHAGPSGMTSSSQSSDNYTSCSCESCSTSSPCSTSFSVQITDETDTSNATTPCETCDSRSPSAAPLPSPPLALATPLAVLEEQEEEDVPRDRSDTEQPSPKTTQSPTKHALFSSNVDFFEPDCHLPCASDLEGEEEAEESHFQHRRMTGDSGIEVCRCQVESEEEEEEEEEEESTEAGDGNKEAEGRTEEVGLLHDSADCHARAQAEECGSLCSSSAPAVHRSRESVVAVESV